MTLCFVMCKKKKFKIIVNLCRETWIKKLTKRKKTMVKGLVSWLISGFNRHAGNLLYNLAAKRRH